MDRVFDRFGRVLEELGHLVPGLEVELVAGEAHAVRLADLPVGLDAEQDILGLHILPVEEVDVVGGHKRQAELSGQSDDLRVDLLLRLETVILELEVEVALGEKRGVGPGGLLGLLVLAAGQEEVDLALETARQPDQPGGVPGQELLVDARPVVEALEISLGQELAQVPVALFVLDEKDEMVVVGLLVRVGPPVETAAGRHIDLTAEDGLDPLGLGRFEELDGSEDVAVVGEGDSRHIVVVGRVDEVLDPEAAVEDAVLRVVVQMDEGHGHSHSIVPGGLVVTSKATRLTPRTSFTMRVEILASRGAGTGYQLAVMPSVLWTSRRTTTR